MGKNREKKETRNHIVKARLNDQEYYKTMLIGFSAAASRNLMRRQARRSLYLKITDLALLLLFQIYR